MKKVLFLAIFIIAASAISSQNIAYTMNNIPMSFYLDDGPVDPDPITLACCRIHDRGGQSSSGCLEGGICYCRIFAPCDDATIIGREDVKYYFLPSNLDENGFINIYFRASPASIPVEELVFNIRENVGISNDGYFFTSGTYNYVPNIGPFGGFKIKVGHN